MREAINAGSLVVRGTTPAQCFKRWRERQQ
jgi:hypothetical protein